MKKFWSILTPAIVGISGPITAIVERLILVGCIWAAAHSDGLLSNGDATTIAASFYLIVSTIFSALKSTQASKIAQVADDADVQKIVLRKETNGPKATIAADPDQPKVEQAA